MTIDFGWGAFRAAAATAIDSANLNSLVTLCAAAAGETSDTVTEIDNSSNKDLYADFCLSLASLNITAIGVVELYLIPILDDDTNWPHYVIDHSTTGNVKLPQHYYAGVFQFNILNGAQAQILTRVPIPPSKVRPAVYSRLGPTWAASGNTLTYRTYKEQGI